jgi:hypothetical protein
VNEQNTDIRSIFVRSFRRASLDDEYVLYDVWSDICRLAEELESNRQSTALIAENLSQATYAVSLLVGTERFRLAQDLLTTFDLVEALPGLLLLAQHDYSNPLNLLTFCALASSPAVDTSWQEHISDLLKITTLSDSDLRLIATYLPAYVPELLGGTDLTALQSDLELVAAHRRPTPTGPRLTIPIVVFLSETFPDAASLRAMGDVSASGALVRRLTSVNEAAALDMIATRGVVLVAPDHTDAHTRLDPPTSCLWPQRVEFINRLARLLDEMNYAVDMERFLRSQSKTSEQSAFARSFLSSEEPFVVKPELTSWAQLFEQMRADANRFHSQRDRAVLALVHALAVGSRVSVNALEAEVRAAEPGEPSDSTLAAAVTQALSLYSGDQLHYLSPDELNLLVK